MPQLNTTTMAIVDELTKTLSWLSYASSGRFCGLRYATAMTQTLLRMSFSDGQLEDDGF